MVFHWSVIDSKSPQVSRTLLSILAVLNNAVVWMVFTRPPTSNSSSPFSNPFVTVPNAPITIGTIVTFIFRSFFNSLDRSRYLFFFFHILSVLLCGQPEQQSRLFCKFSFFFLFFFPPALLLLLFLAGFSYQCYYCYPSTHFEFFILALDESFTGVWVEVNLSCPGFFTAFWPTSTML